MLLEEDDAGDNEVPFPPVTISADPSIPSSSASPTAFATSSTFMLFAEKYKLFVLQL
jgi:hypothetical protein